MKISIESCQPHDFCCLLQSLGIITALVMSASCGIADEIDLLTDRAFEQALAQPIDAVNWKGKSLRGSLERITQSQRVAVMLDRRVDPDQLIEFSASRIPLQTMLEQLGRKYEASVCRVGPVIYIGPEKTTRLLPTVVELQREQIRKLPSLRQRRLLRATPWRWDRLASPRQLLDELEQHYGVSISGKQSMPHDLWPTTQLPELDFAAKLSLVLAGFHVTFKMSPSGDAVQIVAMPEEASLSRRYAAGASSVSLAEKLGEKFPSATFRADGRDLLVDGGWEVHDAVKRLLSGQPVRPPSRPDEGTKTYTLTVENKPVGGVMQALGRQLGKKVVFDVKVERRLTKEISLDVKEVTLEQLLTEVASPAALKYEIEGDVIRVFD